MFTSVSLSDESEASALVPTSARYKETYASRTVVGTRSIVGRPTNREAVWRRCVAPGTCGSGGGGDGSGGVGGGVGHGDGKLLSRARQDPCAEMHSAGLRSAGTDEEDMRLGWDREV